VYELQRLRSDHEDAVLNFEVENRAYFALSISDRGEEFFEEFTERTENYYPNKRRAGAFYVLVGEDGTLVDDSTFTISWTTPRSSATASPTRRGRGVATTGLRTCVVSPVKI